MNTEEISRKAIEFIQKRKHSQGRLEVDAVKFAKENKISNCAAYDILAGTLVLVGIVDAAKTYSERRAK